jgi:hypothetical protein
VVQLLWELKKAVALVILVILRELKGALVGLKRYKRKLQTKDSLHLAPLRTND